MHVFIASFLAHYFYSQLNYIKIETFLNISGPSKSDSNIFAPLSLDISFVENQPSSIPNNNGSNSKCFLCKMFNIVTHFLRRANCVTVICSIYYCRVGSCGLQHLTLLHKDSSNISQSLEQILSLAFFWSK